MDKSKTIIAGTAALVALIGISGLAFRSFAAEGATVDNASSDTTVDCPMREGFGKNLSAENKAVFEAKRAEIDAARTASMVALDAGDYAAWVKTIPADAPILTKINEANFSKLVEAHKLQTQANQIRKDLGIEGIGMGRGEGMGRRRGGRMMGGSGLSE